ncbi:hypothetical protein BBJ29_001045 [Phytophthora kernoviae]|uniref:RxLR effector protein n=1 Tax=Phytophthora kernoviae TaxID=325452 RepID=A0A3F2RVR5_9STRA|nr:hypothetical protein BBJ29_001045 [Phytophthora kernoviae]RLN65173.1 hypothetical protein BBP00_00003003 [Phytophthora kernoviae]
MQLIKGLFIAAALCVAHANATVVEKNGMNQHVPDEAAPTPTPEPIEKGYSLQEVNFASGDVKENGEDDDESSSTLPIIGAVGACAVVGVLAAVYVKRRNEEEKLPGEIFTIDDKNSVLLAATVPGAA